MLIKAGGYRSFLVEIGQDKNLDDLAGETKGRQSSSFEVMQGIEDACSKALAEDLGYEWAQFFRQARVCRILCKRTIHRRRKPGCP